MYSLWQDGNFPQSIHEAIKNLPSFVIGHHGRNLIPARFFYLNASLVILSCYRVCKLLNPTVGSLKSAWRQMPRLDKECILFFTILSVQIAPLTAKPFRRYLLLYIPLIILSSRSILPVSTQFNNSSGSRILVFIRYLLPASVAVVLISPFLVQHLSWSGIPLSQSFRWSIVSLTIALLVLVMTRYLLKNIKSFRVTIPAAILLFVFTDGILHTHGFLTRSFSLRDTSRRLGEEYLTPSSSVLGGIANSLCLENHARALTLWGREEAPRVLNQDPIRRFAPDYILIMKKLDGLEWGREQRYDRYALKENLLETLYLLPQGDSFRVEAELYRAPLAEPETDINPRILI